MDHDGPDELAARYSRQLRLPEVGRAGQQRLGASAVSIIGCGALGTHLADHLARAGVGRLRLVDRDVVELDNLQRQTLFDEADAAASLPKAEAAARHLARVNSGVLLEPRVQDATPRTIAALVEGTALVLDGTDNLETRYLINDLAVKAGIPWVYGGSVGTGGMVLAVRPGAGACLRCIFPSPPAPGTLPTCETHGVLPTAPATVAALQATAALRLLLGHPPCAELLHLDLWRDCWDRIPVARDPACPCCGARRFDFLEARATAWVSTLCGRNAVQIAPPPGAPRLDLERLRASLAAVAPVRDNGLLVAFSVEGCELVVFPDGRALVRGTTEEAVAKRLYTRYIGS